MVYSRREYLGLLAAATLTAQNTEVVYGRNTLPSGIRSRFYPDINGLSIHTLEAGFEEPNRPCALLLHGYPELAYSWRKIMLPLAAAGYHVVAPDVRGYGMTLGGDTRFEGADLASYSTLNLVRDAIGLLERLKYKSAAAVVGHDAGSPIAAWCAVSRPDVFRKVAMMSAPFGGTPAIPSGPRPTPGPSLDERLAKLPRPRKYYQAYYSTAAANPEMYNCRQGLHDFFRAYYHYKSADWKGNNPHPLKSNSAEEMAQMPPYYVMDLDKGMAETVAEVMPTAPCKWLTDEELNVYVGEYRRTRFQGGLQSYRRGRTPGVNVELQTFAGRTIDQPSIFIAGKSDWGVYQTYGAFERMQKSACTNMHGAHLIEGAGHWVMQEQPEEVSRLLIEFLRA